MLIFDLNLSETHFDLWRLLNYYPFFLNSSFCERISMFPLRKKCFSEIYTFWQRLWFYNFLKLLSINSIYRFFVYVLIFFHMERRYALNEVFFPPYKWITMCLKYLLILNFSFSFSLSLLFSFFSPLTELAFDVFKEVVSELIAETIGSYLGVGNRRKDSEDGFGLMEMILNALRKQSLRKKRGCL